MIQHLLPKHPLQLCRDVTLHLQDDDRRGLMKKKMCELCSCDLDPTSVNWLTGTSRRMACGPGATMVTLRSVSLLTPASIRPPSQYHRGASTSVTLRPSVKSCLSWQTLAELGEMGDSWPRMVSADVVFPQPMFPSSTSLRSEADDPYSVSLKRSLMAEKEQENRNRVWFVCLSV